MNGLKIDSLMCRMKFWLKYVIGFAEYINIKLTPLQNIKSLLLKIESNFERKKEAKNMRQIKIDINRIVLYRIVSKRSDSIWAMNTKQLCFYLLSLVLSIRFELIYTTSDVNRFAHV